MKKTTYLFTTLISLLSLATVELKAQSCNTGKLDPKVADFLKMMPPDNRTLEDFRKITNFEEIKKGGPPPIPYPSTDVEHIKITADSLPVLVFNPLHEKGLPIIIHFHTVLIPYLSLDDICIDKSMKDSVVKKNIEA